LLLYLSPTTRLIAAIAGGAGFGAFVDELGKFVTSDNNYFFKPTAAILYALFVILFLATREIRRFRGLSPEECLVNSVELAERLASGTLTADDRDRALQLLTRADQAHPLVAPLRAAFVAAGVVPTSFVGLRWVGSAGARTYAAIVSSRWFRRILAAVFILAGVAFVLTAIATVALLAGAYFGVADAEIALQESTAGGAIASVIQAAAGLVAGVLIVRGVFALRRSRLRAYRLFELAILVDLLLAQPFAFLDVGFGASVDVFLDLALLATLRFLQTGEKRLVGGSAAV
jgi:hypothetical protein